MKRFEITDKKKLLLAEIVRQVCNHRVVTLVELSELMRINPNTAYNHLRLLQRMKLINSHTVNVQEISKGACRVYFIGDWGAEVRKDILWKYCNERAG